MDEETAEEDSDVFDCDDCPVAAALAGLDDANREAWALYRKVITRLSADLHAGGVVLERLTREMDAHEFDDTWRRLVMLYAVISPLPDPKNQET